MSRNLVICCDGTNNQFGSVNTNVVRLVQVLDHDPQRQRLYYDPGVGTLPEPGAFTAVGQKLSMLFGLAFGVGLTAKVERAYSYLMDFWEPGDRVFLFGFSRGAYTARVLAALLHALGLLPRGNHNLVPYVMRLFKSVRKGSTPMGEEGTSNYWKLLNEFRWTFARQVRDGDDSRRFPVHFLGIWDTVSSVGWIWDPAKFPYTARNPSTHMVRHAVSIDERRWFFRQNQMYPAKGQDFEELWFPGAHADVGGGYAESEGGLWRLPFQWMLDEGIKAQLAVDFQRLQRILHRAPPPESPWAERQHESLTSRWWPAEFFPKWRWREETQSSVLRIGCGGHRPIRNGSLMHQAVLMRMRTTTYLPPNISAEFVQRVRDLAAVPATMVYEETINASSR